VNATPLAGFVLLIVIGCAAGAGSPTVYVAKSMVEGAALMLVGAVTATLTGTVVLALAAVKVIAQE
jgi:hypothetical protein